MKTFEEHILHYLDGTLSDSESAELMHQLSVSPEKRVVLEQHLQLRDAVSDAKKPYPVPASVEQKLIERIPALAHTERETAVGLMYSTSEVIRQSLMTRSLVGLRGLLSRYPVRFSMGALATIAGLFLLLPSEHKTVRQSTSEVTANERVSPSSNMNAVQTPAVGGAAHMTETAQATHSSDIGTAKITAKSSDRSSTQNIASTRSSSTLSTDPSINRSSQVDRNHAANQLHSQKDLNSSTVDVSQSTNSKDAVSYRGVRNSERIIESISHVPGMSDAVELTPNVGTPPRAASFAELANPTTLPLLLRIDLGGGTSYIQSRNSAASPTKLEGTWIPTFGVDYVFSPYFAVGGEFGSAGISHVAAKQTIEQNAGGITRIIESTTIESENQFFAHVAARYTLNPYELIQMEASVGGGIAFDGNFSPMTMGALSANYGVTEQLAFSLGAVFTGTFTDASAPRSEDTPTGIQNIPDGATVGFVQESRGTTGTLFVPSITARIGLRYRLW